MKQAEKISMKLYLDEIGSESLLTTQEEAELAENIQNGDKDALESLTKANLKFVVFIAKQYQYQGVDIEDLVSEGNIGLLYAAKKYKSSKGKRFALFSAPFIRKQIEQLLLHQGIEQQSQFSRTAADEQRKVVSVEAPIPAGSRNSFNLLHVLKDTNVMMADERINNESFKRELERFMRKVLDIRQQQVISLFFGIGCEKQTLMEIGNIMNLKRERIRQIRDKALQKIRKIAKTSSMNE